MYNVLSNLKNVNLTFFSCFALVFLNTTERNLPHVSRHRLNTYGRPRAFVIAGLSAWNSLSDPVCNLNAIKAMQDVSLRLVDFLWPVPDLCLTGDHIVGKLYIMGRPSRPTQLSILQGR